MCANENIEVVSDFPEAILCLRSIPPRKQARPNQSAVGVGALSGTQPLVDALEAALCAFAASCSNLDSEKPLHDDDGFRGAPARGSAASRTPSKLAALARELRQDNSLAASKPIGTRASP